MACLLDAEDDVLASYGLPPEHRRQIRSTSSLKRLNKEVTRRYDAVGIFRDRMAPVHLVGPVREDQKVVGRFLFSAEPLKELTEPIDGVATAQAAPSHFTHRPCDLTIRRRLRSV